MPRTIELAAWLGGRHIAWIRSPRLGTITCSYTSEVLANHDIGTPLLSCSLPVRKGRIPARAFVTGLLPEGQHRAAMADQAGVPTTDLLGMLRWFGRDVAGAVTLAPLPHPGPGASASPPDPARRPDARVQPLTPAELAAELARLPDHPIGLHPDSELSIAGLQDKMLLVATDAGWGRPVHGYPSSHILKIDSRVHRGLVRAEHACLSLARAAGLSAAGSSLLTIEDAECLVVERFDRRRIAGSVERMHQEDSCQALGVGPDHPQGRGKYEASGGPSLGRIAALLDAWSDHPEHELLALLDRITFSMVIGDADAHGKNVSLLHPKPGRLTLAPLYDTVPTALWPRLRTEAAMSINRRFDVARITRDDLIAEAHGWGLGVDLVTTRVDHTLDRLTGALADGAADAEPRVAVQVAATLGRLR